MHSTGNKDEATASLKLYLITSYYYGVSVRVYDSKHGIIALFYAFCSFYRKSQIVRLVSYDYSSEKQVNNVSEYNLDVLLISKILENRRTLVFIPRSPNFEV
jgi:hypothetical protein